MTVSTHVRRLNMRAGRGYAGRRVAAEVLARSGVRVSELCDLRIGQVRLHGPDGGRFRVVDAKTETGIREVQMTPELATVVSEHLKRLRRIGAPTGPNAYLVQNVRGGRTCRGRVARMLAMASASASEQRARQGPTAATQHDAAYAQAHLYLDRAGREQLRCEVGDGAGRPRGLADDDGCVCAARQARAWRELRPARAPGPRARRAPSCGGGMR